MLQVLESSSDGTLTHPALLKDRVSSPAGTTIAGVQPYNLRKTPLHFAQAVAERHSGVVAKIDKYDKYSVTVILDTIHAFPILGIRCVAAALQHLPSRRRYPQLFCVSNKLVKFHVCLS